MPGETAALVTMSLGTAAIKKDPALASCSVHHAVCGSRVTTCALLFITYSRVGRGNEAVLMTSGKIRTCVKVERHW